MEHKILFKSCKNHYKTWNIFLVSIQINDLMFELKNNKNQWFTKSLLMPIIHKYSEDLPGFFK